MRPYHGLTKDGRWVKGWLVKAFKHYYIYDDTTKDNWEGQWEGEGTTHELLTQLLGFVEVIPSTVGQSTGLQNIYAGDYCVMDCWNGGDGIEEPSHHDIFEGVVVYDQKICRWGLQTKLCDKGQIEVGLEDSRYTSIEVIGNVHQNPELLEAK